jgi:hypothetical protein
MKYINRNVAVLLSCNTSMPITIKTDNKQKVVRENGDYKNVYVCPEHISGLHFMGGLEGLVLYR